MIRESNREYNPEDMTPQAVLREALDVRDMCLSQRNPDMAWVNHATIGGVEYYRKNISDVTRSDRVRILVEPAGTVLLSRLEIRKPSSRRVCDKRALYTMLSPDGSGSQKELILFNFEQSPIEYFESNPERIRSLLRSEGEEIQPRVYKEWHDLLGEALTGVPLAEDGHRKKTGGRLSRLLFRHGM
jgi:hypothetical protein